jgi:DNA-binding transcriptional MerR regulator
MQQNGLIKIGELARRAGVNRGTVQHYLREGLLPKPAKTHRNMAYYDGDLVDRIRLIKQLQEKRRLPLAQIKELIDDVSGTPAAVAAIVNAQEAALSTFTAAGDGALALDEAAKAFDMTARRLRELIDLGIVSAREHDGRTELSPADVEVLAAIVNLRRQGFSADAGFPPELLKIYKDAVDDLLSKEVGAFLHIVVAKKRGAQAAELAKSAVDAATGLLVALRRKAIFDLLQTLDPKSMASLVEGVRPQKKLRGEGRPRRTARERR